MSSTPPPDHIKTRFLILSDTHNANPLQNANNAHTAFRPPLPKADVLLHCGDLTMVGLYEEYEQTIAMLADIDADLKLVIAGNHDISLDEDFYHRRGHHMQRCTPDPELPQRARALWTGPRAKAAGITFLDEGTHTFILRNTAKLRVYASPYQPEFCDWAFPYWRNQDRYNPPHQCTPNAVPIAVHPIPDFPAIDILMTHGPPKGLRDATTSGEPVGCEHLLRAARRSRPRLHCFGHIHEAWGAERVVWREGQDLDGGEHVVGKEPVEAEAGGVVDVSESGGRGVVFGRETLVVNASVMTVGYRPLQAPWLVDLDLEVGGDHHVPSALLPG